jgi:hypothetical protein
MKLNRLAAVVLSTILGTGIVFAGVFTAVQNPVLSGGGSLTVCGITVGNKKVQFAMQTPDAPANGFLGQVWAIESGVTNPISNTRYVLQFLYNSNDRPCAKKVDGTTNLVQFAPSLGNGLTAGHGYYATAFFKPNQAPPTGTVVILTGDWIVE